MATISNLGPRFWLLAVFLLALVVSWQNWFGISVSNFNPNWFAALSAFFAGSMIANCETAIRMTRAPDIVPGELKHSFGFHLFSAVAWSNMCLNTLISTLPLQVGNLEELILPMD